MKLTREERARILAGDHSALKRKHEPQWEEGETAVLVWSRAHRTMMLRRRFQGDVRPELDDVAEYPRQPLVWVELAEPKRHRDGSWRVGIKVHDERVQTRFLAPSGAPTAPLTDDTARGYRATAAGAIDHLEAVDEEELKRQQAKSKERWMEHQEEHAAEEQVRRQERALRRQLQQVVRGLPLEAGQALLAAIERDIRDALERQGKRQ